MSTRIMYDSITVDDIPADATIVAGYYTGTYANLTAMRARFPNALVIGITPTASVADGIVDVLDVENGDATPAQTEGWIAAQKAKGYARPTIYCSLNTVPAVRTGTGPYVLGVDYDLWVADYDGSQSSVYPGSAAKQYENDPTANYDVSVIYDDAWPHRPGSSPATNPSFPLKEGDVDVTEDGPVHTTQENLNKWAKEIGLDVALTVDGDFGPLTEAAVTLALIYWNYSQTNVDLGEVPLSLYDHLEAAVPVPTVKVPDVIGRIDLDTAESIIKAAGLVPEALGDSGTGNKGIVTAQSPAAGTSVDVGSTVTLTYTVYVEVPDVIGRTDLSYAESLITAAGLTVVAQGDSGVGNEGKVTAQSPAAGAKVAKGTTITLTYTVTMGWVLWPASVELEEGSTGNAVKVLQTALCNSNMVGVRGITVNGDFGSQTLTAVRNFQAAKDLTVDGIAGPETRAALVALNDL